MQKSISAPLLAWYDEHARDLPWRGIHDPYRTWVSETMLQQTRVETVRGYYARFLERFPDIRALAAAPQEDVLKLWEGLGYYSRARNLHLGARQVVDEYGGTIPSTVEELRKISGIGPYTAGAIASIAFDRPVPAVDGNVIRVVSRLRGIRENTGIPSVRRLIEACAGELVPELRPGDFNQALMDLGSAICTPGTPSCDQCPLQSFCDAYEAGDAEELPVLPRKNPPKKLEYNVFLIVSGDRILMRQRTETMLKGLWIYPMTEGWIPVRQVSSTVKKLFRMTAFDLSQEGEGRHVFTHQVWNMHLFSMKVSPDAEAPSGYSFVTLEKMRELAIPTAVKSAKLVAERLMEAHNV